jgi:hypothetical protein
MTGYRCERDTCVIVGQHASPCRYGPDCHGCRPALARDGGRICTRHTEALPRDILASGELFYALGMALDPMGSNGALVDYTTGTRELGLSLNPTAVEYRTLIQRALLHYAYGIALGRGFTLPAREVASLARYVARSGEWLAARPEAGHISQLFSELAHGEGKAVAYPSGRKPKWLGQCPEAGCRDAHGDPGEIYALLRDPESRYPTAIVCTGAKRHTYPPAAWLRTFAMATAHERPVL